MFTRFIAVMTLVCSLVAMPAMAQDGSGFLMSDADRQAIEEVVEGYLRDNPEVVLEVVQEAAQAQADSQRQQQQGQELSEGEIPDGLYDFDGTPMAGNPDAEVTVVEFFDYNCGFCKRVVSDVNTLVTTNDNVKVLFKELPILRESSELAARYALAAEEQGKYLPYHTALMNARGDITLAKLEEMATDLDMDIEAMRDFAQSERADEILSEHRRMARELGVGGTPYFIIGDQRVPGAISLQQMRDAVRKAEQG